MLSQSIWIPLFLGTGYWDRWKFELPWLNLSGGFAAFVFFSHATKALILLAPGVLSAHLTPEQTVQGRAWKRLCPSSPASQSCQLQQGPAKPGDLISQEFAGNIERAALLGMAGNTFGCRWCCPGVGDPLCLGASPSAGRWIHSGKPWQSGCCRSPRKDLGEYGCSPQNQLTAFISVDPQGTFWNCTQSAFSESFHNNQRQKFPPWNSSAYYLWIKILLKRHYWG